MCFDGPEISLKKRCSFVLILVFSSERRTEWPQFVKGFCCRHTDFLVSSFHIHSLQKKIEGGITGNYSWAARIAVSNAFPLHVKADLCFFWTRAFSRAESWLR